ncbi:MAG TPA: hypothetical protein VFQ44_19520 [Streptosporangiaceae bacterium]|nr:hypothetical protein [Streptosporangiaceae bacterium]
MATSAIVTRQSNDPNSAAPRRAPKQRDEARQALEQLLDYQHLVVTRRQALDAGLTTEMLRGRIRSGGRWQTLLPGVYLTVTGTPTQDQRDTAALLYAGPGSALTGTAALRWHGICSRGPRTSAIDVLVPARRRRQSTGFVNVRLTTKMPELVCCRGPVRFVLQARAIADRARTLYDFAAVREAVAHGVQSQHCTIEQLAAELRSGPKRGSGLFRAALAEVADGVRSISEAELRELIARGGLPEPMYNPSLYCGDEFIAVPDAWWPELGVAAEADSKEWHLLPAQREETMRRHARMTALGILILHFTPRQIRHEPDYVLAVIKSALRSRQTEPPLSVHAHLAA